MSYFYLQQATPFGGDLSSETGENFALGRLFLGARASFDSKCLSFLVAGESGTRNLFLLRNRTG